MKTEQRRRLTDLYTLGKEHKVTWEPEGEDVAYSDVVWVRKMTPTETETAYAKASAARASVLAMKHEAPSSDQFVTLKQDVKDMDDAILKLWAVSTDLAKRRPIVESRIAYDNKWMEEGYLGGLMERAGDEGFRARSEESPEDPEVVRVLGELQRFEKECETAIADETQDVEAIYDEYTTEQLQSHVLEELIKMQADAAWLIEYRKCQVWLCTMENEKRTQRYFQNRAEVDLLQEPVLKELQEVCEALNVPDGEGKGSPPNLSS